MTPEEIRHEFAFHKFHGKDEGQTLALHAQAIGELAAQIAELNINLASYKDPVKAVADTLKRSESMLRKV